MKIEQKQASIFEYSFDIEIEKPLEQVWQVMFEQINGWWMNDFRALGQDSVVSLKPQTGAALLETTNTDESLEWYKVQMCVPLNSVYLVGYLASDWGGPTVSMLKLGVQTKGDKTVLTVTDSLLGNVSEKAALNAKNGWMDMFTNGLKAFAERQ